MKRLLLILIPLALVTMGNQGCEPQGRSADAHQTAQTAQAMAEADRQIGMPDIVNFTERKLARDILELRDQEKLTTWTYLVDMHGKLHLLGQSVGYGLPYSVQFTNPERIAYARHEHGVSNLPQPDPNGLFMPEGLSATWILLVDEKTKKARPVYVESEILVSPFKLNVS